MPDRPRLIAALHMLAAFYESGASETQEIKLAKMTVANTVTKYAMGKFVHGLVDEHFIRPEFERALREQADNLSAGRGFLTNDELHKRKARRPTRNLDDDIADNF